MCKRDINCMPPTGGLACNLGTCPDWEPDWRSFGLQACVQSTEPHLPGLFVISVKIEDSQLIWYIYLI